MRILPFTVLVLISLNCKTVQSATPTDHELELAKRIFQGMEDNSKKLTTGIFAGTEAIYKKEGAKLVRKPEIEVFFCVFDHSKKFYHFLRDTGKTVESYQIQPVYNCIVEPLQAMYIRRPEYSLHWSSAESNEIQRKKNDASPIDIVKPFDVRCVGVAFLGTMERYYDFQKILDGCRDGKVINVDEKDKICRIDMQSKASPEIFYSLWFDSKQDYQPIRTELFLKSLSSLPLQRGKATWQKISDVWVVKTFVGEDFDSDRKLTDKTELTFKWKCVNEPVPEKYFTPEGMDLPPSTRIFSYELGTRVPQGTVSEPVGK